MRQAVVFKSGPLVLVKRIIVLEILVSVALFAASFITNYEKLYQAIPYSYIIRYNVLSAIVGAIIQLALTLTAFLHWYGENCELNDKEIIIHSGLMWRHHQRLALSKIQAVSYRQGPLEKLTWSGTIIVELVGGGKPVYLSGIENGLTLVRLITEAINRRERRSTTSALSDIIKRGENHHTEFKQTFRFDIHQKASNKELEKGVMKTIAGFLNADGGTLVIGVADDGQVTGLADDYQSLIRKDHDGFENHFTQVFGSLLGAEWRHLANVRFETIANKDLGVIELEPSPEPIYLKVNSGEEFYVRTGNTTTPLSLRETRAYIETHWS